MSIVRNLHCLFSSQQAYLVRPTSHSIRDARGRGGLVLMIPLC